MSLSSSSQGERRLDAEEDLQAWFATLDREPGQIRPEFLRGLRDSCREELARQGGSAWSRFWRLQFGPRHAAVALAAVLVVVLAAVFAVEWYPGLNASQAASLTVRSGRVAISRPVQLLGSAGLVRQLSASGGSSLYLRAGDEIVSGQLADAQIALPDGSKIAVGPSTQLTLEELQGRSASKPLVIAMRLDRGAMRSQVERLRTESGDRFEVSTPSLVAHVKGTIFRVDVQSNGTRVATDKGLVHVSMGGKAFDVEAGRELMVRLGESIPEVNVLPQPPSISSTVLVRASSADKDAPETYYVNTRVVPWLIQTMPRARVTLLVNDAVFQNLVADDSGAAQADFTPNSEGTYRISATMETPTGEQSLPAPVKTVVVDYTNPALLLTSPTQPQVASNPAVLAGTTEPGAELLVNGESVPVDGLGDFRYELPLVAGANQVTLVATDPARNKITLQSVIVYEPAAER